MVNIQISKIMDGKDFPSAGSLLYDTLLTIMDKEDKVSLDMKDVPMLPSMFLNMSLGRIIRERGVEFLKSKFVYKNIKVSDINRLKEYVSRFEIS